MGCPDDNDLTCLLDGELSPDRRQQLEDHVDGCQACQGLIAALARVDPGRTIEDRKRAGSDDTLAVDCTHDAPTESVAASAETISATTGPWSEGTDGDNDRLTLEQQGRYSRGEVLGVGGIGTVSLAFDRHLERLVAVKELNPSSDDSPESTTKMSDVETHRARSTTERRFLAEARITGSLEHPGIMPVYELGKRTDNTLYYTMKLVRGRTLAKAVHVQSLAARLMLLPNFLELCHAVGYAHSHGVIHRDLKPHNVMLGEYGETILLDWGLAKIKQEEEISDASADLPALQSSNPSHTVAGAPIGTPAYMPPEQARGDLERIDERSDVYSLGAILYQILTSRPPHTGSSSAEVMCKALGTPIPHPVKYERTVPSELAAIAMRALSKEPAQRYPNAMALAEDVLAYQTGQLVRAHTYTLWSLVTRWFRVHRKGMVAACVVLLVATGAWWYRGHKEKLAGRSAEQARQARVLREVDRILIDARESTEADWLNLYTYKLIALKEPAVEQRLIEALGRPKASVRRLAARSLGGMKSAHAIHALTRRLGQGLEPASEVVVEVVNALGIIGDWRTEEAVATARWRSGQRSFIWKNTDLAYSMIPLPPIETIGKPSAEKWHLRGRALFFKEKMAEALQAFSKAIALDPRYVPSYNNRSVVHKVQGNYRAALADLDKVLELDPKVVQALGNRGMIRRMIGDYEGARADLKRALDLDNTSMFALVEQAQLHALLGDKKGARADYQRMIALKPRNPSTFFSQGTFWFEQKRWAEALASFTQALTLNPRYVEAFVRRAEVNLVTRRTEDALADLDRALTLDPRNGPARTLRARLRLQSGDLDAARKDLDRSVQVKPSDGLRWVQRAVILQLHSGQIGKALEDLKQGVRRARRSHRVLLLSCALAVAVHCKQEETRQELLETLGRQKEARYFEGLVTKLILAQLQPTELAELQREAARLSGRGCLYHLAAGIRAALDGRHPEASVEYRRARQDAAPHNPACLTAAAITAGTGD